MSSGGGVNPRWGRDGRELSYINVSKGPSVAEMMAVPVKASSTTFEFGAVVNRANATPITIVLNWWAGLKK